MPKKVNEITLLSRGLLATGPPPILWKQHSLGVASPLRTEGGVCFVLENMKNLVYF